jgi:hypothetical protein
MPVSVLKPSDRSAGYGSLVPEWLQTSCSGPPTGMPDIVVVALGCGTGLVVTVPFLPSLSSAMVNPDTFSFLVGLLG